MEEYGDHCDGIRSKTMYYPDDDSCPTCGNLSYHGFKCDDCIANDYTEDEGIWDAINGR